MGGNVFKLSFMTDISVKVEIENFAKQSQYDDDNDGDDHQGSKYLFLAHTGGKMMGKDKSQFGKHRAMHPGSKNNEIYFT